MSTADRNLDAILVGIGDFGKFQRRNFIFVCIAVLFTAMHFAFIFTSRDLNYRCKIPECDLDLTDKNRFNSEWISNAIPYRNGLPSKCEKFQFLNNSNETCQSSDFDQEIVERCSDFIYETEEKTIVQDFDIHCSENLWKLTLVGTINNIGQFVCLPFAGFVSDRFGRRTLLICGLVLSGLCGLARSISFSYMMFVLFEFLDTAFGSGSFSCSFILGVELVGPNKRVLMGSLISCAFAIGEIIIGLVAWYAQSWRLLLQIIYAPALLLISYFWLIPESVRWLLTKGRYDEAEVILRQAAKVNGKVIPSESLDKIRVQEEKVSEPKNYPIFDVFKSTAMLARLITCSFCWMTCTFLFYGLSLNSVALAGNIYLNFIITSIIEIPAYFAVYILVDRIGRRSSQLLSFCITGLSCFAFLFLPNDQHFLRLCMYLIGKFGSTAAFTVIYIFTSEMFPTPLRHSLVAFCSMFGRIGSMVAPQIPLVAQIWSQLPLVLFGSMAAIAGFLSLTFPETLNIKLPDTIEEALEIGKSKKNPIV